jgi:putative oxidoreductase
VKRLRWTYSGFAAAWSLLQPLFLLAVRLYWGWQFTETGWGKLNHLPKVTQFFSSLGLPAPGFTATLVGGTELLGGLLLAAGLASRLTGLALFVNMTVAYFIADKQALLSIFADPGKFYGADPYTFWFAALIILLFGPGKLSLDALVIRARRVPDADSIPVYMV